MDTTIAPAKAAGIRQSRPLRGRSGRTGVHGALRRWHVVDNQIVNLVGVGLLIVGVAVAAVHTRQLLSANPDTRIPWIGWPDRRPRYSRVLIVVALTLVVAGGDLLTADDHAYINLWPPALIWAVGLGTSVVPIMRHNRRITR